MNRCVLKMSQGERALPCRDNMKKLIHCFRDYFYPGYFSCEDGNGAHNTLKKAEQILNKEIKKALILKNDPRSSEVLAKEILDEIVSLGDVLESDLKAFYLSDPAAEDFSEIILTYPGLLAIYIYRIAHVIYKRNIYYLPRLLTEMAHSKTGIDIHPGATIGKSFFIDHGTGIVIGETAIIGEHVKIYQGVTIGALSLSKGQLLKGQKRHPTIGDNVTIYANAAILGGETVIGNNCVIGGNVFLVKSVPDNMLVTLNNIDLTFREIKNDGHQQED